jgi:hypothetical protein
VPARLDNINLLLNAATALHVYKRKQSPRLFQHNSRPWCSRAAQNIKWRSSSKQCNSFLFPLFLPLFPVPRLRRASERAGGDETIWDADSKQHLQIPGATLTHKYMRAAALTIKIPLLYRRHCWQQRAKNVKWREWERAPFFAAKINCGAASS